MSLKTFKLFENLNKSITEGISVHNFPNYDEPVEPAITETVKELTISSLKSCACCQATFEDLAEQRLHFKLDWHRYNLKRSLLGRASITADDFDKLADDVSSISGSESETEEEEKTVNRLQEFRNCRIFWSNQDGEAFSIYRCLLLGRKESKSAQILKDDLLKFLQMPKNWMIIMLGGGHFAAAVFESGVLKMHKTFHSYTVRAKQGGSQSTKDNRGGNHPKSAGASLRRYNELALTQHVQEILEGWSDAISKCSLILYRAAGPGNQSIIFGGKILDKTDTRLRVIPLATRRATLKEVKRVYDILSCLHYHGSEKNLEKNLHSRQMNEHFGIQPKPKNIDRAKERQPRERALPVQDLISTDEDCPILTMGNEEIDLKNLREFDDSVRRKRRKRKPKTTNKLTKFDEISRDLLILSENFDHNGLELKIKEEEIFLKNTVCDETGDTILHIAAEKCQPEMVRLLLNIGCDPTIKNGRKMLPYVLSGDKTVKKVFRTFASQNPDKFDYQVAMIPPPLTEEEEKALMEKKKERKKKQKEREKNKKIEIMQRKTDEDDRVRFLALSDREKRALAAEKRIIQNATANTTKAKVPVLNRCFQCGKDITGKVPFEYNNQLFCSIGCLKEHRTKNKA